MPQTMQKQAKQKQKKYRIRLPKLLRGLLQFNECEVFIRKDAPQACTTVLADFSSLCGCSCCGVSVA